MGTPYQEAAVFYAEAGWSPIPLPYQQKFPVPDAPPVTGAAGEYVDVALAKKWSAPKARVNAGKLNYTPGNIALRLPKTVLGIDVDAYGEKKGADTLAAAEEAWGPLPPTWVSTSRDDKISGIRLFRIPEGLAWPGELPQGKGVELLRWDHRFAIVSPSIHDKTRAEYRWYEEKEADDGSMGMDQRPEDFPAVDDLPALPEAWVDGLTSGEKYVARAVDEEMTDEEIAEWIESRPGAFDKPCTAMRKTIADYSRKVRQASDDGGAHDEGRNGAWAICGDAKAGHSGVREALAQLRAVFLAAVRDRRPDEGTPKKEWRRAVERGIKKLSAEQTEDGQEDPCISIKRLNPKREAGTGSKSGGGRLGSGDIVWRFDDIGNAERLIRVMDGRARWVPALGTWMLWTGKGWEPDTGKQVDRWAVKAVNQMEEELAFLEGDGDEDKVKAFKVHKKSSGTAGKLKAMVDVASGRKGIIIPAEEFDGDPRLMACSNGVLELREDGVEFRGFHEEQYITLNTGVDYKPEAKSAMWEEFLELFQPDEEVRTWLQRIVGYSLLGYNPSRFLVALIGPTSTGKSTFAEAIRTVLGTYAGPMTASVLRDNADDRPRPDILAALPRRVIIAEELGAAQHLHPDQIKRLTGGSLVSARGMRANVYINRRPAFTPWIVANNTPTIEGADAALRRRLLVVPFGVRIAQRDERVGYFETLMKNSREAILAWVVEGYRLWTEDNQLGSIPLGALQALADFTAGMSDFHQFIFDCCDAGDEFYAIPMRLYEAYEEWLSNNSINDKHKLSVHAFGRRLTGLDFAKGKRSIGGKQVDVRLGLRIVKDTKIEIE